MNFFRTAVERLTRSLVIKRKLPAEFGSVAIYVAADSALQYLKPTMPDHGLFEIARRFTRAGSVVWDVGANIGIFAFAAAACAGESGKVIAIEADIWLAGILRKSCELKENKKLRIVVLPVAASNSVGISRLLIAKRGRSSNSLEVSGHRSQAGGTRYVQYTPTVTLDSLLQDFDPPTLLKIDVEGAEQLVLTGASEILKKHRPVIYCEVGQEQDEEITRILRGHRYRLFDASARLEQEHCSWNTLAVPAELDFHYS